MVKSLITITQIVAEEGMAAITGGGSFNRTAWRLFGDRVKPGTVGRKLLETVPLGTRSYFSAQDNYRKAAEASECLYNHMVDGTHDETFAEAVKVVNKFGYVDGPASPLKDLLERAIYHDDVNLVRSLLLADDGFKTLKCTVTSISGPKYTTTKIEDQETGFLSLNCGREILSQVLGKGSPQMLQTLSNHIPKPILGNRDLIFDNILQVAVLNQKYPEMGQALINQTIRSAGIFGGDMGEIVKNAFDRAIEDKSISSIRLLKENFMPGGINADKFTINQKFADEALDKHAHLRAGNVAEMLELKPSAPAISKALKTMLYNENDWLTHYQVPDVKDVQAIIRAGASLEQARYSFDHCMMTNSTHLDKPGTRERANMVAVAAEFGMDEQTLMSQFSRQTTYQRRLAERDAEKSDDLTPGR